ncbi:hypothetical protein BGW41_004457 [Actinomortierella wolfii]|nr:hypothetical protein BGW41_004457 [Actinomortierella wolfii]
MQQQGQITSAAAGSNGNTATTANTISTRGGASHDVTSTDTSLAQNDALSIYGPSFRNILCANPRGRSLKKIVEMKAIQLQKRQTRRALSHAQYQHRDPEYSLQISARKETCNNISERTASVIPNDQLVTPWYTRFLRGASNNVNELNGGQTLDGDVDDDDDDEDLDADWIKGMLAQMEGECYYADMPFELLHLVFGNFLRVSMDNLKQLAERKKAKAMAIKAAERELEDRWAKTPLLPGMAASTPGLSQKRRSTCTCNVCRHHQHSSQPSSPSSTYSEQQQYAPSTLPSRRHTSPNTMHEQMPTNGHQVLVNHLASSPPSSGYASASSADVPQYPTHSDESDLYLDDGGDSRSEFESEAYSGEDDEDSEDHESLGHLRRQDDLESVDDIVASLSISNGYQSGYSSDDLDAQSVESTDTMEQIDRDFGITTITHIRLHMPQGWILQHQYTNAIATAMLTRRGRDAMLDSYLDLYGLDLAKNVQTVELDLQLLSSWSLSNGGNAIHVKRIIQRLAPFNHLRLVCSERPSSSEEDFVTNFRFVMEAHYGHIRHLHFSPGFAISRAWAQEMDRMHALEKLTIESLNSMERVDYDWSRIRVLVLHAIVPSSLFGIPRPIPISLTPPTPPPTPYNGHENGGSANTSMTSHDVTNGGSLSNNGTAATNQALPLGTNMQASPHSLPATDSTTIVNNTLQNTSTVVVGTPHGTFFHLNGSSPTTSLLTFMPSSYTHPNLTQYLLHHHVTKLVRQPRPGWWLWNSLRRLEVTIKNVVLPREWLQELVMVLSHRAQAENDLIRMHEQEANVFRRPKSQQDSASLNISSSSSGSVPSRFESYQEHMLEERLRNTYGLGPRLEVIHLDCEVSHPHKEIFMDLMNQWGHQLREFHFSQSAELTDEFFWCCLQRGKNLRRLSLGDSKGITGEGVELGDYQYHSTHDLSSSVRNVDGVSKQPSGIAPNKTNSLESAIPATLKLEDDRDHHHHNQATTGSAFPTPKEETKPEMKRVVQRVAIGWPRDFEELRLDQSRVRSECLIALKQHCPGMRYKVRDIRWSKGQRKPDLSN